VVKKFTITQAVLIGQNAAGAGVATTLPFDFQKLFSLADIPQIDLTAMQRLWARIGIIKVKCLFTPNGFNSVNQSDLMISTYLDPSTDEQVGQPITADQMLNRWATKNGFWGCSNNKNLHSHTVYPKPLNNIYAGPLNPDGHVPMTGRRTVMLDAQDAPQNVPHYSITVAFTNGLGANVAAPLTYSFWCNCRYTYFIKMQRPI